MSICDKLNQLSKLTFEQNLKNTKKSIKKQSISPLLDISFKSNNRFLSKGYEGPILVR